MSRRLIFRANGWLVAVHRAFAALPRLDRNSFGWNLDWGWLEIAHVRSGR